MASTELQDPNSIKSSSKDVVEFLIKECGVCPECVDFVIADHEISPLTIDHHRESFLRNNNNNISSISNSISGSSNDENNCTVSFGLLSLSYQNEYILPIIKKSLLPYCQVEVEGQQQQQQQPPQQPPLGNDDIDILLNAEQGNHLTRESPTVNLPWVIAIRAHCAISAAKWYLKHEANTSARMGVRLRTAEEVYLKIKESLRSSLNNTILESLVDTSSLDDDDDNDGMELLTKDDDNDDDDDEEEDMIEPLSSEEEVQQGVVLSGELHEEEAGYLGVHVIVLPPSSPSTPPSSGNDNDCSRKEQSSDNIISTQQQQQQQLIPPSFEDHIRQNKRQIIQSYYRILHPRKRFRGNDPTLKQGGDPRNNLELKVRRLINQEKWDDAQISMEHADKKQKIDVTAEHEWNMVIPWLEKNTVLQWLEANSFRVGSKDSNDHNADLCGWLRRLHQSQQISLQHGTKTEMNSSGLCSVHAASFRRPFYVQGTYTKSQRDISQTPFYVPAPTKTPTGTNNNNNNDGEENNGGKSVQSHNAMVRKGVSSVEEEICPPLARIGCGGISKMNNARIQGDIEKGAVVYGLCKFHASGREDMDVRMLLPPPSVAEASVKSGAVITGRPFVCEIFDAHKMPTVRDLEDVAKAINCQFEEPNKNGSSCGGEKEVQLDKNGWPMTLVKPERYHGNNPRGVGVDVSVPLSLVSSKAFSGLQSETEEKVKLYGCVCHTSVPITSDEELLQKLGCSAWNKEGEEDATANDDDDTPNSRIYPLKIQQSTPLRVLHRRSSDVRTRYILSLSACRIDDHWFRLRMSTSAGTYVKEFVHGDCGRTQPNISSMLGGRTDITELDCEGIAF